eukprot:11187928-Lingulodinium_polyedra.AAC.1
MRQSRPPPQQLARARCCRGRKPVWSCRVYRVVDGGLVGNIALDGAARCRVAGSQVEAPARRPRQ